MPTHKFQIGQTVFLSPSLSPNIPGGAYIVTRKLPERDGEYVCIKLKVPTSHISVSCVKVKFVKYLSCVSIATLVSGAFARKIGLSINL
jgi:hypothetical protein